MTHVNDKSILWAKRSAVYTLSQRAVSTEALRQKIAQRASRKYEGIDEAEVSALADAAVAFCLENGFLNDQAYAEYRVAEGVRKGHSRRKIAMTLQRNGIERDHARGVVCELDDFEAALNLAKKKGFGPWRRGPIDNRTLAREAAAFARNGFSSEIVWKIVKMDFDEVQQYTSSLP